MPEVVNTSALVIDQGETEGAEDSRPVMIDVDHVSMSFNMASEQLNSLKEYALALAKGKLFFEEFKALDDVSFQVRKGDVFGIMGTNGSGKSTILKIIAGVLEPTKGKCTVNGNIAPLIELGAGFDMDLSARENIYLNGALLGYSRDFINEHFDEIVEFAEVEKFLDMPLKNYSSGMVSRIAFAIATVIVPEILVVDEVLSVGDFMFQRKCENRITQLIEEYGVTVLIVSHSNDQIARLCNKAIWIEKGHERLQGDAKMVAHVYGGLGGRTGSKESEQIVFEALLKSFDFDCEKTKEACRVFSGESPASICNKMALEAWRESPRSSVALVCDNTHVNAVIANGLAGALKIPVLSSGGGERLSEAVERALAEMRPETVFFFDVDCLGARLCEEVAALPWGPRLIEFAGDDSAAGLSLRALEYGTRMNLWSDTAYVVSFEDNAESLALAPLAYSEGAPVIALDSEYCAFDELEKALIGASFSRVVFVGPSVECAYASFAHVPVELLRIAEGSLREAVLDVFETSYSRLLADGHAVFVGSSELSQWPNYLSMGYCGGLTGHSLMLVDKTNLDSEARCLEFLSREKSRISRLVFVGGDSALSPVERGLLLSALVDCGV